MFDEGFSSLLVYSYSLVGGLLEPLHSFNVLSFRLQHPYLESLAHELEFGRRNIRERQEFLVSALPLREGVVKGFFRGDNLSPSKRDDHLSWRDDLSLFVKGVLL